MENSKIAKKIVKLIMNKLKKLFLIDSKVFSLRNIVFIFIGACGLMMRLRIYLFNRSLWSDEALLALNIVDKNLQALITEPLDYGQAAPFGFVASARVLCVCFGHYDYILRILPFIASLGTLIFGGLIARKSFRSSLAQCLFLALISFSPVLLYYSTEFKHYSLDVFITMVCIYCYMSPKLKWWGCALVGGLGLWFSHPVVFVMAGIGIGLLVDLIRKRDWRKFVPLALLGMFWLISFGINYAIAAHNYAESDYLNDYWRIGYAPFPITSLVHLGWYLEGFAELSFLSFLQHSPKGPGFNPTWFFLHNLILMMVSLAGFIVMLIRRPKYSFVILFPFIANLIASAFGVYPFRNRLILYLLPLLFWAIAYMIEISMNQSKKIWHAASWTIASFLIITVLFISLRETISPPNPSNVKTALKHVSSNMANGDALVINGWGLAPYRYYKHLYSAGDLPYAGEPDTINTKEFVKELRKISTGRIWVLHMHDMQLSSFFSTAVDQTDLVQSWQGDRASVYLLTQ